MFEKMPDYLICEAKVGETEAYLAEEERAVGEWMRERGEQSRQGRGEVLAQYECAECAEGHYHTRRQVRPSLHTMFPQLSLVEQPGYQFANPVPPSVRSVGQSTNPIR